MTLFDFILSLLLVFNPSMPESTFDQVYTVLDDTQLRSVLVEDSAVEALSQLAGNAGIMPLEWAASDTALLRDIYQMLYTGTSDSVAYWTRAINQRLVNINDLLSYFPDDFEKHSAKLDQIYNFLTSINKQSGLVGLLRRSNDYSAENWRVLNQISGQITDFSSSNAGGWDKLFSYNSFDPSSWTFSVVSVSPFTLLADFRNQFLSSMFISPGFSFLGVDGLITTSDRSTSFSSLLSDSFLGLAFLMSGDDRLATFSFLKDDLSAADEVTANNLLDALGLVGTQLQNPLQRLAYVLANPQDIQIREDVSGNVDQAQEDFFKPEGGGSVKPSDIKDAAGISGGAAGALESPGSVGDVTAQINNQDNFSFFSDVTLGNLDSVPVTFSDEDDGFIDFYDPSNPALWEALSNEPVS